MDLKVLKDAVFKVKWSKCASWKVKTNPKGTSLRLHDLNYLCYQAKLILVSKLHEKFFCCVVVSYIFKVAKLYHHVLHKMFLVHKSYTKYFLYLNHLCVLLHYTLYDFIHCIIINGFNKRKRHNWPAQK